MRPPRLAVEGAGRAPVLLTRRRVVVQQRWYVEHDTPSPDHEDTVEQLIQKLTTQADLTEDQAKRAIDVFIGVIDDRLPDAMVNPVIEALKGNDDAAKQLQAAADGALGKLGSMFGK